MRRPLRLLHAAGPGDIVTTYRCWRDGRDDPSQVALTFSGQFYDVCREAGHAAYVISSHPRTERLAEGPFVLENRPVPFRTGSGPLWHLGQLWWGLRLVASALWFGADAAVIFSGSAHWFVMWLLPALGIPVIASFQCVLWRKHVPPRGVYDLLRRAEAAFFRRGVREMLSASYDITRQLTATTDGRPRPIRQFVPTYPAGLFDGLPDPPQQRTPFKVFFAGRIEADKGVFDLLAIARRFAAEGREDIEFDLAGKGSALDELRRRAAESGLGARFRCHGHCTRPVMRDLYAAAHVVIVPTTTDFIEGFNQVVAEGVMAGRPVITSSVCPALEYVAEAVVEVPPDDVTAYGDAVLRLADDREFYEARRRGCRAVAGQFYDDRLSWRAALSAALDGLAERRPRVLQRSAG